MLDPWIIEEILRREEERHRDERTQLEVPVESPQYPESEKLPADDAERGVVIIDI